MAKVHPHITPELRRWIEKQHLFFVATAPLSAEGHINLSPKGHDCLRVLSEIEVAYLDLTGSGNETSAHIHENGRITFLFCAFNGPPRILRLYGQGRTVLPGTDEWDALIPQFPVLAAPRQIIIGTIDRVSTSCGFAVPLYEYQGERDQLDKYAEEKGEAGMERYRRTHNCASLDGLPTPLGESYAE